MWCLVTYIELFMKVEIYRILINSYFSFKCNKIVK
jgi:hypothetical protein